METDSPVVFIVDDDEAICESLRLLIGDIGLEVRTFTSAREFLEKYDSSRPGCLVLDVRMSGMSGLELQSRLRELGHSIPTIIITGHGDVPMAVEAMKAGAMDFIEKPFRDQVLLDSIQKAIDLDLRIRRQHKERQDVQARIQHLTQRER
ncbi:MAG TPA: response regulator [Sedimentisphaerales bacterium]|jgi:FixJ family two-component response regulator|nr:response regulator [Sedimentisphaerales bacterium]HNU30365.1 response regulator [Sedimentisphaerales bacterium]